MGRKIVKVVNDKNIKHAVLWIRVSSREQKEGYSLDAQEDRVKNYCIRKGLTVIKQFTIVESSTRGERKEFYNMINFIKKYKDPIALVCDKVDRLQRSFKEYNVLNELIEKEKMVIHFQTEQAIMAKNAKAHDKMMWNFRVTVAQSQTDTMSDNVIRSFEKMRKEGKWAHHAPVGYKNVRDANGIRILELINKRTLQFDGIFGMSDDIVGNFNNSLNDILERRRTIDNILADFSTHLAENWQKNEEIVTNAESVLFTTFTKDIAEKVTISPKYIEEQAELLNADLWEAVKFYFQEYFPQYVIDEDAKTISLPDEYPLPHLFYYNSGSRNVPYTGKRIYGMDKDFKPAANKMTLISPLLKGIFSNIECYEEGKIKLAEEVESCEITFYIATLYAGNLR